LLNATLEERTKVEFRRETLPALAALAEEWRHLEERARPSFFTSWRWLGAWLAAIPEASRPMLLRGRAQGRTVGLALLGAGRRGPLRMRALYLNESGDPRYDAATIEHNGLLVEAGYETAANAGLIDWFAGLRGLADELHLRGAARSLPVAAAKSRGLVAMGREVLSYSIELDRLRESGGGLDPVLSANARQQLRRAMRHFERFGPLRVVEPTTTAEALSFFAALKELHSASWARRDRQHAFAAPFFEPFHRLLIERNFAAGDVQLLQILAGERVLGYLYNLRLGERVYAYQSGFADSDRHERPGSVCHALAIAHAFRAGAAIYDFMAGWNRLKQSFATDCEPMLWQAVQRPSLRLSLERLARRVYRLRRKGLRPATRADRAGKPRAT
jgi:CelD/BcsL family acetyltransferase involved in cellulose biosynthesis